MKQKKKGAPSKAERSGPTFEEAIQRLEKVVADMESAGLPLEQVLKKYEEGTALVRFCSQKLEEAEKKIELLTKKTDGSVALQPFDLGKETAEEEESKEEEPHSREANLF